MAVTIKQIAQKSGFSASTVSHAISGRKPGVRPLSAETVAIIKKVALELGYRPNLLAAGLAQRKTYAIGILVGLLRCGIYERILESITEVVYPEFSPMVAVHGFDKQREKQAIDLFLGRRVDGLIAACSWDEELLPAYRSLIKPYGMPLVLVGSRLKGLDCPVVRGDEEKTAYLAACEMIKLGHKKIMYVVAQPRTECAQLSKNGYSRAMAQAGLDGEVLDREVKHYDRKNNMLLAEEVVARLKSGAAERPTAVICRSDWLAYEVLGQCQLHGLKVPGDISIMGLQGCETSSLPTIGLSTAGIRFGEIGRVAANIILELINSNKTVTDTVLVEPELVMRQTTGPRG